MEYYFNNIKKALDFIEENIHRQLTISEIAAVAGYSAYHFQRLFSGAIGEPLREYVRGRKLTNAARLLATSQTSILDLALEAGFESQEAFSRAFKRMFSVSPGAFRKNDVQPYFQGREKLKESMLKQLVSDYFVEHEIVEWPERYFVGMGRAFGDDIFNPVGELWAEFSKRICDIPNGVEGDTYGLCLSRDPEIPRTSETTLIYISSIEVTEQDIRLPEGLLLRKLPAAKYAKFSHRGPLLEFQTTLDYIWGRFLPQSKYKRLEAPDLEVYPAGFDPGAEEVTIYLYIPIKS